MKQVTPVDNTQKEKKSKNFIEQMIDKDIENNTYGGRVHTRFPPEPNGYLHIGHAKSILLNYGIAQKYNGKFNLRFDDTNPEKESDEYVKSIIEDVKWLGVDWEDRLFFASDYFEKLYDFAVDLIKRGKAYVCELTAEEVSEYRGTINKPGKESPWRNRPVAESLALLEGMRKGEFEDGSHMLRAKIDMAAPNMLMRDPVLYRIRKVHHHRTGDKWKIYPMYDFAHGQSDYFEGITNSICTLEFEIHRPLYEWLVNELATDNYKPRQTEFARLNLTYTVMSKRKLLELVEKNYVSGWDDPRMPTISGMRRRGFTPKSIQTFCEKVGTAKRENTIDVALLEHSIREDLNRTSQRVMAVLKPLKVVITNYPEGKVDELDAVNNPEDESMGTRKVPFSREIYIEQDDFMENPPRKFFRLGIGREVRLRYAYFIKCENVIKDSEGNIIEVHCTYDPASRGGKSPDGRKVKGTLHWVSAKHALKSEVRVFDRLFVKENPNEVEEGGDFKDNLNPNSLITIKDALVEPFIKNTKPGDKFQFERLGYFCTDPESTSENIVFNRTVPLRDNWSKKNK